MLADIEVDVKVSERASTEEGEDEAPLEFFVKKNAHFRGVFPSIRTLVQVGWDADLDPCVCTTEFVAYFSEWRKAAARDVHVLVPPRHRVRLLTFYGSLSTDDRKILTT
jgi:hypothetical protein